jgi:hypothetical protein
MLSLAGFRAIYGEFKAVSDTAVQSALDFAEVRTDASIFTTLTNEAHGWLTADILASRPSGREAKMKDMPNQTVYGAKRAELEALVGGFQGGAI